jgi:hypothetical protein
MSADSFDDKEEVNVDSGKGRLESKECWTPQ